mmetsp:Transcript_22639/g.57704  ORF Transcript_22639/g.57704 Transcript_22639/m.57704 type:complete len:645 (-) Transcript_22639:246-2180(-)
MKARNFFAPIVGSLALGVRHRFVGSCVGGSGPSIGANMYKNFAVHAFNRSLARVAPVRCFQSRPILLARRSNEEDLIWTMIRQRGMKASLKELGEVINAGKVISIGMLRHALASCTPEERIEKLHYLSDLAVKQGVEKFLSITYQLLVENYVSIQKPDVAMKLVESLPKGRASTMILNRYFDLRLQKKEDIKLLPQLLDRAFNEWEAEYAVTTFNLLVKKASKFKMDDEVINVINYALQHDVLPSRVMVKRALFIAQNRKDYYLAASIMEVAEKKGGGIWMEDYMDLINICLEAHGKSFKLHRRERLKANDLELVLLPLDPSMELTPDQKLAQEKLNHLHDLLYQHRLKNKPFAGAVANVLIQICVLQGNFSRALQVFDQIVQHRAVLDRNTASCLARAMISTVTRPEEVGKLLDFAKYVWRQGTRPDKKMYMIMLQYCLEKGWAKEGLSFLDFVSEAGVHLSAKRWYGMSGKQRPLDSTLEETLASSPLIASRVGTPGPRPSRSGKKYWSVERVVLAKASQSRVRRKRENLLKEQRRREENGETPISIYTAPYLPPDMYTMFVDLCVQAGEMALAANLVANMHADGYEAPLEKLEALYDNLLNFDAFYDEEEASELPLFMNYDKDDGSKSKAPFFFVQDDEDL